MYTFVFLNASSHLYKRVCPSVCPLPSKLTLPKSAENKNLSLDSHFGHELIHYRRIYFLARACSTGCRLFFCDDYCLSLQDNILRISFPKLISKLQCKTEQHFFLRSYARIRVRVLSCGWKRISEESYVTFYIFLVKTEIVHADT